MPFPQDPLPVVVQAKISGSTWTDITADTYVRDGITISRGQSNEGDSADPSSVSLTLNNRAGRYSPRNPTGPHYGLLRRNTELRVGIVETSTWLDLPGWNGVGTQTENNASCPDSAGLSITGDIEIVFDADLDSWDERQELVTKWVSGTDNRSYALWMRAGIPSLSTSVDGEAILRHASPQRFPIRRGRMAVRVFLDVNNGTGGRTHTWFTAPTAAGPWQSLGGPVTEDGTTSIYNSTAPVVIGDSTASTLSEPSVRGRVYSANIRQGINGTLRASPDFTTRTPGDTSFADAQGNTWTLSARASISNLDVRGHGEVSTWPTRWDVSGKDVSSPISADGLLRRLGQGEEPLRSALYRAMKDGTVDDVIAYWPMEDAPGASSIGSALKRGRTMEVPSDDNTSFGAYSGFQASSPIVTFGDNSFMRGRIRRYTATGSMQMWSIIHVPADGCPEGDFMEISTGGTAHRLSLQYVPAFGGSIQIQSVDSQGNQFSLSGPHAFAVNGKRLRISLDLIQDGANVRVEFKTLEPGAASGNFITYTLTGRTIGVAESVTIGGFFGVPTGMSMGHVSVQSSIRSLFEGDDSLNAFRGERAGRRIQRLCKAERVPFHLVGNLDDTQEVGYQLPDNLLTILKESAKADGGILCEPRDAIALMYVPRSALQAQPPSVVLPYGSLRDLEPVEDDQNIANDVTLQRAGGSSRQAEETSGPLSVSAPPAGAGRYPVEEIVNLAYDRQLRMAAQWRLHLGTVDEARHPTIEVELAHPTIADSAVATRTARDVEVGSRVSVSGPMPVWVSPDDVEQLAFGLVESIEPFGHQIRMNCVPYRPYAVGTYDPPRRTLAADSFSRTNATSLQVADVGGEWQLVADGVGAVSTTGSQGLLSLDRFSWRACALDVDAIATDTLVRVRIPSVTGGGTFAGVTGRNIGNNNYRARLHVSISGATRLQIVRAVGISDTLIGANFALIPYVLNSWLWMRVQVVGANPTTIRARFWPEGSAEPSTWQREVTDSNAALQGSGGVGIWSYSTGTSGALSEAFFDDLLSLDLGAKAGDRYDASGATLASGVTSTATTLSVASPESLWTLDPSSWPFDVMIGGERCQVTAVSGVTSPQTFTVTRSTNGVVKTHSSGAPIRLADTPYYGL